MDWGADFYAAVSWNDMPRSDPRRIWIGWANNWDYALDIPADPARGLMSVPRTVRLLKTADGYRIAQAPVAELERWRTDHRAATRIRLGNKPVALPVTGGAVELQLEIDTGTAKQVALVLTDGEGYQTLIGVASGANQIFIDRTRSGPRFHDSFTGRHAAPVVLKDGKIKLRVLVDESIVELYANDGTATITDRFFRGGSELSWSMLARGGTATVRRLNSWTIARP